MTLKPSEKTLLQKHLVAKTGHRRGRLCSPGGVFVNELF